ncbi:MAG: hypothetical protein MZU91_12015 [Desulfosudis oleivorans]|nr:hypothetical protein [Desulfosudis oleivorans]
MIVFGIIGYIFRKLAFEPGPLLLAFVLGTISERAFRQSLLMSKGSPLIFFERPVSAALMIRPGHSDRDADRLSLPEEIPEHQPVPGRGLMERPVARFGSEFRVLNKKGQKGKDKDKEVGEKL